MVERPEFDSSEGGSRWRIYAAAAGALVCVIIGLVILLPGGGESSQPPSSPQTYEVHPSQSDDGSYDGTFIRFKVPAGVTDVSGLVDGSSETVTFNAGSSSGRIGSSIADPRVGIYQTDTSVYPGELKRSEIELAGAKGTLLRSSSEGWVMLIALSDAKGRHYELQISAPDDEAEAAERTLRELAAAIQPTDEALHPSV